MAKELDWSKIKNMVLSSGIPLEISVAQKLQTKSFGFWDLGEYVYERDDKVFSVDIRAQKYINVPNELHARIQLLIECKYREPNKKWYFFCFENPYNKTHRTSYRTDRCCNIYFDFPMEDDIWKKYGKNKLDDYECIDAYEMYSGVFPESPIAQKGIEIVNNDNINEPSITHALYQLSCGAVNLISKEFRLYYKKPPAIFSMIFPIIVTTADLYLAKKQMPMKQILNSKKIEDIFEKVDYINYLWEIPTDVQQYSLKIFHENGIDLADSYNYIREYRPMEKIYDNFSLITPGRFSIVNYNKFEKFLKELLKNINNRVKPIFKEYKFSKDALNITPEKVILS